MQAFEELKKKIKDIETQSLAMDGCSPSFSVNDILSIIDSVGKVGTYDTDFPCNGCVRREKDYYEPE